MTETSFLVGFVTGALVAGLFGSILQQLRFARKKMASLGSPQSVAHKTDRTPAQILVDYIVGAISFLVWFAILVGFVLAVFWLISNGF